MPGIVCYPTPSAWHIALEQQVMIGVLVTAHLLQHFAASVMFHELSASTHTVLCARWVSHRAGISAAHATAAGLTHVLCAARSC
jgi:hypothetical protein